MTKAARKGGCFAIWEYKIFAFSRTSAALISPLRGQLLPEGEAFGAPQAKSLLPLGEGVTAGD
jgi:hypothetical protein